MYELFIYDFLYNAEATKASRVTVVFSPHEDMDADRLIDGLRGHFDRSIVPDQVVIVGTEHGLDFHRKLLTDPKMLERLPAVTRYLGPPALGALQFTPAGKYTAIGDNAEKLAKQPFVDALRQAGLMSIFQTRNGILESQGLHHYVKPSGKHSDRFIRTANVLIRSAEVGFIALWLLPFLKDSLKHIYTDTAAINLVAYAAVMLRRQMAPGFPTPSIDSFGSYTGLPDFRFHDPTNSLLLISASTSADLEAKVLNRREVRADQIVTLFYLGSETDSQVLCDIGHDPTRNPNGYERIRSYDSDRCPLCREHLAAVSIVGDQFLPESPCIVPYMIRSADVPSWLNEFMEDFAGRGVVSCYHRLGSAGGPMRDVFLHLDHVFRDGCGDAPSTELSSTGFLSRLDRVLTQSVPAKVRRIICLDDIAAKQLAERIKCHLGVAGVKLPIITAGEMHADLGACVSEEGTSLVVASTVASGRSLMSVSQSMRQIQKNHCIQYLVGVSRAEDEQRFREICSNVQYGEHGPGEYDLHVIRSICLPDDAAAGSSSWDEENAFLHDLGNDTPEDPQLRALVNARRQEFRDAPGQGGFRDNLFWRSTADQQPLKLRPNFAFWNFDYAERNPTQADVFLTVTSVLHGLRGGQLKKPKLQHHEHSRHVLSPHCFERFNDGVIQASILRGARRAELDYRASDPLSRTMKSILESIFENYDSPRGEASLESYEGVSGIDYTNRDDAARHAVYCRDN